MNSDFLHLLVHPETKENLVLDEQNWCLVSEMRGDRFQIKENVPILLPISEGNGQQSFDYREHYEKDAETYDYFADWIPSQQEENRRLRQHILREIPKDANWVLDIGCGGGWLSKSLCPKGKQVISTDISTINPVRALLSNPYPNHFGLVADVFALPVKKNSIDCIVASEIIEHVSDPQVFISALYEVLKPGGKLIITTPYNETIQQSLCIHCNQLTPHNAHLHSFTQEKIKSLVPKDAKEVETSIFNSKLLFFLKLHLNLKKMSYPLWNFIDKMALKITQQKALRLMLILNKW